MYIHDALKAETYPNQTTLSKKFELKNITMGRAVSFMRDSMGAPIDYDPVRKGYYYTDKNYELVFKADDTKDTVKIAEAKESFAQFVGIDFSEMDKLETITDLGMPGQSDIETNLSCKYSGRNYCGGNLWIGFKVFALSQECQLCIGVFEDYNNKGRKVTDALQGLRQNYIAEDCPIDYGYWLYVLLNKELLYTSPDVARSELLHQLDFLSLCI